MSAASGFGPNPWQQTSWDWRAAGNFICGGAGTGLLVAVALFGAGAAASLRSPDWLVFTGLARIGLGLMCVWLEIGRPLRALNVFINPRTSWMSREAWVSVALFPAGLAALLGLSGAIWLTAALALAFLYCQSRMLPAARGIPAWRSPWFSAFIMLTRPFWCRKNTSPEAGSWKSEASIAEVIGPEVFTSTYGPSARPLVERSRPVPVTEPEMQYGIQKVPFR